MLSAALGFDRYAVLTPINGCPRCQGPIFTFGYRSCLLCGWAGPTRTPGREELRQAAKNEINARGALTDSSQDRIALAVGLWERGYSLSAILERVEPHFLDEAVRRG